MKVSTEWLSDYISLDGVNVEELAEQITRSGIEIDSIENRNQGVSNVVVGFVKSKEKHPDADKLNICVVDAGQERICKSYAARKTWRPARRYRLRS